MDAIILFVLKSTLISGIFCAWYMLALRNRRMHRYNRLFLLLAMYASLQVPLLNIEWAPAYEQSPMMLTTAATLLHTLDGTSIEQGTVAYADNQVSWKAVAVGIAALISLGMALIMLMKVVSLLRIARRYPTTRRDGVTLVHTNLPNAPFSFMNRIYWRNDISPDTESGRIIMRHELAHVRQRHSYDKLACQLLTCIFWMNPFYWLIRKELNMVHEFIADEQAIVNNDDRTSQEAYTETFAKMLLEVHSQTGHFAPENRFFSSPVKRRLTMLQTIKTVKASLLRRAAVLPLIAGSIFIFAFTPREASRNDVVKAEKKIVLVVDAGHGGNDAGCRSGALVEKDLTLKVAKRMKELAPRYNIEVHLTREEDKELSLKERVAFSNQLQPDDFLSIHIDAQPGKESGNGTFGIAVNTQHAKAEDSKRLAYAVHKYAARPEWQQTNLLTEANPYILKQNASAAALIEMGDIKNREQMQHIQDDAKLNELCSRILQGVVEAHRK